MKNKTNFSIASDSLSSVEPSTFDDTLTDREVEQYTTPHSKTPLHSKSSASSNSPIENIIENALNATLIDSRANLFCTPTETEKLSKKPVVIRPNETSHDDLKFIGSSALKTAAKINSKSSSRRDSFVLKLNDSRARRSLFPSKGYSESFSEQFRDKAMKQINRQIQYKSKKWKYDFNKERPLEGNSSISLTGCDSNSSISSTRSSPIEKAIHWKLEQDAPTFYKTRSRTKRDVSQFMFSDIFSPTLTSKQVLLNATSQVSEVLKQFKKGNKSPVLKTSPKLKRKRAEKIKSPKKRRMEEKDKGKDLKQQKITDFIGVSKRVTRSKKGIDDDIFENKDKKKKSIKI